MKYLSFLALLAAICVAACKKDEARQPDTSYNPEILAANFTNGASLTNPYFTFEAGKKYIFEGQTEDGLERIEVQLLPKGAGA